MAVRLPDDVRLGIEAFIADQPKPPPNQSEAIRLILTAYLRANDYMHDGEADGVRMRMRDDVQMRLLRDIERDIRSSEFWRGKPEGAEAAVKRLYRTGAGDCGGPVQADLEIDRQFEAVWAANPELARSIDWRRVA